MKIALVGSAPSSLNKAPFDDQSWKIWGCSPGLYPFAKRVDAWFEIHRWEPPIIGDPSKQVAWFSPEYCAWMAGLSCPVWMHEKVEQIPNSQRIDREELVDKYGNFFFTSSLSWMAAMAIEEILNNKSDDDWLGFWGVDMAAKEEYVSQRGGCHFFATLAASLGINIYVPAESDLMIPPPLYGVGESTHRAIKMTARTGELRGQRDRLAQEIEQMKWRLAFLDGALDDMDYHTKLWAHEGEFSGTRFEDLFGKRS